MIGAMIQYIPFPPFIKYYMSFIIFSVFLYIFHLLDLSDFRREILKYPTMTVNLSTFPYNSVNFYFINVKVKLLGTCRYITLFIVHSL